MNFKSLVSFVSKLSQRERVIFYVTVSVISVVCLDRVILSPILTKINNLSEMIKTQEDTIEQSLLIVTQEKRIEGEASRYSAFLSKPQSEEKTVRAFLQEMENLAKKSSIYLTDIKSSGQDTNGPVKKYYIKLNLEAQMEQVFNFFYNVTNFEQLIKIEDYQIRPKSEGSSVITCSVSISKSIILE